MAEILRNPAIGNFDDDDDTIEVLGERIEEAAEGNMTASQPITGKCEADGRSSPGSHIAKLAPHRLRIGRQGKGRVTKHGVTGPIGIERAQHLKAGQSALAAGNSNSLRYTLHLICRGLPMWIAPCAHDGHGFPPNHRPQFGAGNCRELLNRFS